MTKIVHKKQFAKRFFGVEETQEEVVLMPITFEGLPPFDLRTLQTFAALSEGETVTLILRVIAPGQGPIPVPVHVGMTWKTALAVADQLRSAALAAELHSAEKGHQP